MPTSRKDPYQVATIIQARAGPDPSYELEGPRHRRPPKRGRRGAAEEVAMIARALHLAGRWRTRRRSVANGNDRRALPRRSYRRALPRRSWGHAHVGHRVQRSVTATDRAGKVEMKPQPERRSSTGTMRTRAASVDAERRHRGDGVLSVKSAQEDRGHVPVRIHIDLAALILPFAQNSTTERIVGRLPQLSNCELSLTVVGNSTRLCRDAH